MFFLKSYSKSPALFIRRSLILLGTVLILGTTNAYSQILIAGTSFDPINPADAASRAYIGMNEIVQYGLQTGSITVNPPIAPSADPNIFNSTYYHAVTDNPFDLDNVRYRDMTATPDYQLVVSPSPVGQTNILVYTVQGLAPGSNVEVRVTYCSVISPTYASCGPGERVSLRGVVNPDPFNLNNGAEGTQVIAGGASAGNCTTMIITQSTSNSQAVGADGQMSFRLNTQQNGLCKAVGIRSIEIYGTPKPKAILAQGNEVCAGEQVTLNSSIDYNGNYQWQVSTNGGGLWTNIPGGTAKSVLYEVTAVQTYQFRVIITPTSPPSAPVTSDPISVNAITCCEIAGLPASRQTIFYDNFGRLDLSNTAGTDYFVWDYSDPLNPQEVPQTTATPFRWPITPAPLGATFVGTPGPINDGQYTVASYITGYNTPVNGYAGARLEWANRVTGPTAIPNPDLFYDHSGSADGGALFLNCPPNTGDETLYERDITNLCFGKQLFFECWIAVFTNSAAGAYNPVDIKVRLTDGGNAANVVETTGTATRQADGGGVWVRIGAEITLDGNFLKLEIINNQDVSVNGNDLVLDDIKIMACAPPPLNLYFDIPNLTQSGSICNEATLPLYTQPSALLTNYYGGNPRYLYQWTRTPDDVTSWQNLGAHQASTTFTINDPVNHASFNGLLDGEKVYFRVIAATSAIYTAKNNFQGVGNYANINDPCKNYSVSEPIESEIICPLPVELVSFTGFRNGDHNQLTWITSSEKNNDHFIIERSIDGTEFNAIGRVKGKGTTNTLETYQFTDELSISGLTYYRLKQVDIDGAFSYSKTIVLNQNIADIDIHPNPNNGSFTLNVMNDGESYRLDIIDVQGKTVYSTQGSEISVAVEINSLTRGFYLVRLYTDNEVITKKMVVH